MIEPSQRLAAHAVALFAACVFAVLAATHAGAIVGGTEPAADDLGARASVIVASATKSCSGLVYGDSFILTAAHCLITDDFKSTVKPGELEVTYGRGLRQPDVARRQATAVLVHENYLKQIANELGGYTNLTVDDYSINAEDIGLIRVAGTHPPGALSAVLPEIDNEYVVCCIPRLRTWPLVWMDVYGFAGPREGAVLHKLRVSAAAPDIVRAGKEPNIDQLYTPRQMEVSVDPRASNDAATQSDRGPCHGDSGGPAFFVATTRSYDVPELPLKLIGGQPLAVGLVTRTLDPDGCGGDFYLVRLDYYRDWIVSHIKQMR